MKFRYLVAEFRGSLITHESPDPRLDRLLVNYPGDKPYRLAPDVDVVPAGGRVRQVALWRLDIMTS